MIHTQETIARAAQLWNGGLSASRVGAEMGLTRNSIIGIANRNKDVFERRGTTALIGIPKKRRTPEEKAAIAIADEERRNVRTSLLYPTFTKTPILQAVKTSYDAERREVAVDLLTLQPGQCKWSLSETKPHFFCAADSGDQNYCEHHMLRSYLPRKERT